MHEASLLFVFSSLAFIQVEGPEESKDDYRNSGPSRLHSCECRASSVVQLLPLPDQDESAVLTTCMFA